MINWKMETELASPLAQEKLVPLAFVRALMVQARAFGKDVTAILEQANFPFNPLDESAARQRYVGVEQYSRLCMMLLRAIGAVVSYFFFACSIQDCIHFFALLSCEYVIPEVIQHEHS